MTEDITLAHLRAILDAIHHANHFTEGMSFEQFEGNIQTVYATTPVLRIAGGTMKPIPDSVRSRYPSIPWGLEATLFKLEVFTMKFTWRTSAFRPGRPRRKSSRHSCCIEAYGSRTSTTSRSLSTCSSKVARVREAVRLNEYAVAARYPGLTEPVSPEEYQESLALAEDTVDWVESIVLDNKG